MDLIEFATGDEHTYWGAKRCELGHPEPFSLEYIAIGNEEVGAEFFERYPYFHHAIKAKYPDIKIINTSGPFASGSEYERGWISAKENHSDLVDEHYYQAPEWFLTNYHRYDSFDPYGPKVFLGEYASWGNTYYNAIVEAAYMTGLEKNAPKVALACYAPLFCNVDYVNWRPNLIYFNNHESFASANYYVQQLFMNHQGDYLLGAQSEGLSDFEIREQSHIEGNIRIQADDIEVKFSEIKIMNHETGTEMTFNDISLAGHEAVFLDEVNGADYSVCLKVKRLKGHKGFFIWFGEENEKNRLRWEVGGWQNQDSLINQFINGRSSCLTESRFSLATDREYTLRLHVNGRKIETFIDNLLINDSCAKQLVIEPLYYTQSLDEATGDIIVKAVNLKSEAICVEITLSGLEGKRLSGMVYELSGYELTAENSFEQPQLIAPNARPFETESYVFDYEFPEYSVTVLRLHEK